MNLSALLSAALYLLAPSAACIFLLVYACLGTESLQLLLANRFAILGIGAVLYAGSMLAIWWYANARTIQVAAEARRVRALLRRTRYVEGVKPGATALLFMLGAVLVLAVLMVMLRRARAS